MPIIDVRNLHKRYGEKTAVDDVSFSVEEGEIFGILGPNGAGKTTTVECVAGMRPADAGSVSVLGRDPRRDRDEVRELLGVQLQEARLPDRLRTGEALDLYASFYRSPADTGRLLESLGIADKRDTQYRRLSGGQKQRLSIALALVENPRVAVFDELTTGLNPQARRDTWDLVENVRDSGVTVVLVTHFMDEAERLCDRIAVVDSGRIAALDTPAGLVARTDPEQRVTFRAPRDFDEQVLAARPEVASAHRSGHQVRVTGRGNLLHAVTSVLAREHVVAEDLRVERSNLDDAFVALTGRSPEA
ncbi:ABC transporter ATP-binding protein [Nocardiopsis algeriensis]|uniref:ABC-2 type transport system ATP-binding protein n=1 Tax=Nocardiopsis algeriensis TaxID=1478215 RepID=A0A841IQ91_9ACTN|nr:ABC transporter ATP-binding protein [Nocardiopsis algeriensis]MBB6119436.1 ABC-2 type transport system ATP-binding protein [Nocardiopsis algeriensis]